MSATGRVVAYPPHGRLLIPATRRRAAQAGLALHMSSRAPAVLAHHVAFLATALAGPRVLPGRRHELTVANDAIGELLESWQHEIASFDSVALLARRQATRPAALALLLDGDRAIAFVKAVPTASAAPLRNEARVLEALAASATAAPVAVARVIAAGSAHGYDWLACSAFPARPHRPVRASTDIDPLCTWLRGALAECWSRQGVAAHWEAMHGDLAPWNLRRYWRGPTALFDWEDSRLAPPGADHAYWLATNASLGRTARPIEIGEESRQFWLEVVEQRIGNGDDVDANERLAQILRTARF